MHKTIDHNNFERWAQINDLANFYHHKISQLKIKKYKEKQK